jgi:hypothetical protein
LRPQAEQRFVRRSGPHRRRRSPVLFSQFTMGKASEAAVSSVADRIVDRGVTPGGSQPRERVAELSRSGWHGLLAPADRRQMRARSSDAGYEA